MKLPRIDFSDLKALPTISFALMLGAGVVMTLFSGVLVWILAFHFWPTDPTVAVEIVRGIAVGLWIALGIIGLVIVALAFGKIRSLSINTPTGAGGSINFDQPEDPPF